LKLMIVKVLMF